MADNFQRVGAIGNAHVGREFEANAIPVPAIDGIHLEQNPVVPLAMGEAKRGHSFNLRYSSPPILVLCKFHRRTKEAEHTQHKAHGLGRSDVLFCGPAKPVSANSLLYRDAEIR